MAHRVNFVTRLKNNGSNFFVKFVSIISNWIKLDLNIFSGVRPLTSNKLQPNGILMF
jgi:hypothetical protein